MRLKIHWLAMCFGFAAFVVHGAAIAEISLSRQSPDIADLSGERGQRISRVEEIARGKAAIGLTILYRGQVACGAALEGRKLAKNANFETRTVSRCSTGKGSDDSETADVSWGDHMSGLRVCTARAEPQMITGLDIAYREVDDEMGLEGKGTVSGFSGSDCDRWGAWSLCDEGALVTGLVLHFNYQERASDRPDALVGLQAVCRDVTHP